MSNNETYQIVRTRIVKEFGEYRVKAYGQSEPGAKVIHQPEADYFTDDRDDARATAVMMIQKDEVATISRQRAAELKLREDERAFGYYREDDN